MQEIYKSKEQKRKRKWSSVVFPLFFCRSPNVDIFTEFLAFDEELNEVAQALDDVVAHLLFPPPIKFHHNRDMHRPLPHLIYNSESEPDSDNEMDPDLHWRDVQDIPSFWLMNIMRNVSWIFFSKTELLICSKTSFCQISVMASSSLRKMFF